jgi:hypothetical protein
MKAISLCSVATFLLALLLYVLVFNLNPLNRIGYAVFISVLPAILSLIIVRLYRFTARGAVATYAILLLMTVTIQGWIRVP